MFVRFDISEPVAVAPAHPRHDTGGAAGATRMSFGISAAAWAMIGAGTAVAATGAGGVVGTGGRVSDPLVPQAPSVMLASKASTRCWRMGQWVNG